MKSFKLYAKAANTVQIRDRILRGADGVEIQMLDKPQNIDTSLCDIVSVHTPLFDGRDTCFDYAMLRSLNVGNHHADYMGLRQAATLAEQIAVEKGHLVSVVVHVNQTTFYRWERECAVFVENILSEFPHIKLLLEHNTAVSLSLGPRGSWYASDLPIFVSQIKRVMRRVYTDRFGTVLDVCHALGTIRLHNVLRDGIIEDDNDLRLLRVWFEAAAPTCQLIHLNYGEGITSGKAHGTVPDKETTEELMRYIDCYLPNATLVLEVRESDVRYAENFSKFREVIHNAKGIALD